MASPPNTPGSGFQTLPSGILPSGNANIAPIPPTSNAKSAGWYVFIGCSVGILLSNTQAAPVAFGILGIALIYQLNLMLQGK